MSVLVHAAKLLMFPLVQTSNIVKECARYYQLIQMNPIGDIAIKILGSVGYLHEVRKFDYSILKLNSTNESNELEIRRKKVQFFANIFFSLDMIRALQRLPDQFRELIGKQAVFIADVCTFCGSSLFLHFYMNDPTAVPLLKDPVRLLDLFINACWVSSVALSLIAAAGPWSFSVLFLRTSVDFANAALGLSMTRFIYVTYQKRYDILDAISQTIDRINNSIDKLWGAKPVSVGKNYKARHLCLPKSYNYFPADAIKA